MSPFQEMNYVPIPGQEMNYVPIPGQEMNYRLGPKLQYNNKLFYARYMAKSLLTHHQSCTR